MSDRFLTHSLGSLSKRNSRSYQPFDKLPPRIAEYEITAATWLKFKYFSELFNTQNSLAINPFNN